MVYRLVVLLLRYALRIFFREIDMKGLEDVPREGPLLLAPNHPNTLMDVLLVGVFLDRRVGFIAKAPLFKNPIAGWILRWGGAVPIYRRSDGPVEGGDAQANNAQALSACEDAVAEGGVLAIFPEGASIGDPRLLKLKTGLARIALGAEEKAPGQVRVVPVALSYDDAQSFRSRARVRFKPVISVAPYKALERSAEEPFQAVRALTAALREALIADVVHVEDVDHEPLLRDLDAFHGHAIQEAAGDRLAASGALSRAINHFAEHEPERVGAVRSQLATYREHLEAEGVDDRAVRQGTPPSSPARTLLHWLLAPLAWWGILNHFVQYQIPRLFLRSVTLDPAYNASAKLLTGLLALVACYSLQSSLVLWLFLDPARLGSPGLSAWTPTLIYLGTLPLSGLLALLWLESREHRTRYARSLSLRAQLPPERLKTLREERQALAAALDAAQADYLAQTTLEGDADDAPW